MEVATTKMKQKMGLVEFADFCKHVCPKEMVFYIEDQSWYNITSPLRMSVFYNKISVFPSRNAILLRGEYSFLCLDGVNYIHVDSGEEGDKYITLHVVCNYCGIKRTYTLGIFNCKLFMNGKK